MAPKQITKDLILESIQRMANAQARKHELYESIKEINAELQRLDENSPLRSFGFMGSVNAEKNPTGFAKAPNVSYIDLLDKEMNAENTINEDNLMEIDELRKQVETLKKENEELKNKK